MIDDYAFAKLNEKREIRRRQKQKCVNCIKSVVAFLFSHIGLAGMVVAYSIVGGFLFKALESPFEIQVKHKIKNLKEQQVEEIWKIAANLQLYNGNKTNFTINIRKIFNNFQREVYIAVKENGWDGIDSTEESLLQWSFAGALLYSVTVITTIGYGHIAPKTTGGRFVTILYALVGIPLTFLYLSNIGNFLADCFRVFYKNICCDLCCCQKCERKKKRERLRLKRQRAHQKNSILSHKLPRTINNSKFITDESDPECQSLAEIDSRSTNNFSQNESDKFDNINQNHSKKSSLLNSNYDDDNSLKETAILGEEHHDKTIFSENAQDIQYNDSEMSFIDNLELLLYAKETAILDDDFNSSEDEMVSFPGNDINLILGNNINYSPPFVRTNNSSDIENISAVDSFKKSRKLVASPDVKWNSNIEQITNNKKEKRSSKKNCHHKENRTKNRNKNKKKQIINEIENDEEENVSFDSDCKIIDEENFMNKKNSNLLIKSNNQSSKSNKVYKIDASSNKEDGSICESNVSKTNENEDKNKVVHDNKKRAEIRGKRNKEKNKTVDSDKIKEKHFLSEKSSKSEHKKSIKLSSDQSYGTLGRKSSFTNKDRFVSPKNSFKLSSEASNESKVFVTRSQSLKRKRDMNKSLRRTKSMRQGTKPSQRHSRSAEDIHQIFDKDDNIYKSNESFVTAKSESFHQNDELTNKAEDAINTRIKESMKNIDDSGVVKFQPDSVTISLESPFQEDMNFIEYQNAIGLEDPFEFDDDDGGEKVTVPISICLIIIAGYIFAGSVLFTLWEDWDYLTGSYFCFITLSTIGFGDIVPGVGAQDWSSHEKLVLCALWLAFGLSLLAMCFNLMQEEVKEKCKWIGIKFGLLKSEEDG